MKEQTTAGLLALFTGGLGVHKFYLGKKTAGILYAVFSWTFIPTIISTIEALVIFAMDNDKFNDKYNPKKVMKSKTTIEDMYNALREIKELLDNGSITPEEGKFMKEKIMAGLK